MTVLIKTTEIPFTLYFTSNASTLHNMLNVNSFKVTVKQLFSEVFREFLQTFTKHLDIPTISYAQQF